MEESVKQRFVRAIGDRPGIFKNKDIKETDKGLRISVADAGIYGFKPLGKRLREFGLFIKGELRRDLKFVFVRAYDAKG